jgi:hypothetical protein
MMPLTTARAMRKPVMANPSVLNRQFVETMGLEPTTPCLQTRTAETLF